MDENNKLAELLSADNKSRKFFASLSPELRKKLINADVKTFELLKNCAENYKTENVNTQQSYEYYNPVCSYNDCTGLIPNGENMTADDFQQYQQLYPFGNPHE